MWGVGGPNSVPFLHPLILRYLKSIVETILIYKHFVKLTTEQPMAKQELVDFWMDFLVEATKTDVTVVRFPVSTFICICIQFCVASCLSGTSAPLDFNCPV